MSGTSNFVLGLVVEGESLYLFCNLVLLQLLSILQSLLLFVCLSEILYKHENHFILLFKLKDKIVKFLELAGFLLLFSTLVLSLLEITKG